MFRIDPQHLLWTLENLLEDNVMNRIRVPSDIAADARLALDRMFEVSL
jgi:quinolinate synthase